MMIVVLTMSDSVAWNSYIASPVLLCADFGFVPKPYYLELAILCITQTILKIISGDIKDPKRVPNRLEVLYFLFQIVTCWGSTISIFMAFPLPSHGFSTDGWYDYNMVVYMFSCSSACITGVQFLINAFMITFEEAAGGSKFWRFQMMQKKRLEEKEAVELPNDADSSSTHNGSGSGMSPGVLVPPGVQDPSADHPGADQPSQTGQISTPPAEVAPSSITLTLVAVNAKYATVEEAQKLIEEQLKGQFEIKHGTLKLDKKRCMCQCYYDVKDFLKANNDCLPEELSLLKCFLLVGLFILLPILPALVTHYFPMLWAYIWIFLPTAGACFLIAKWMAYLTEYESLKNCHPIVESLALALVRCLLVFVALFVFQAPMEIGCFLYGYSLDEMPVDGNEYTGAISQWWHTRDTGDYLNCVSDRASDGAGAIFDVMSWF